MKSCWVVMAHSWSPVAVVIPHPKAVFMSRKEANEYCKKHNENLRTRLNLYIRKAELK